MDKMETVTTLHRDRDLIGLLRETYDWKLEDKPFAALRRGTPYGCEVTLRFDGGYELNVDLDDMTWEMHVSHNVLGENPSPNADRSQIAGALQLLFENAGWLIPWRSDDQQIPAKACL